MPKGMPGSKTGTGSFFEVLEDLEMVIVIEDVEEVEILQEEEAEGNE